jgi:hypothetical protein
VERTPEKKGALSQGKTNLVKCVNAYAAVTERMGFAVILTTMMNGRLQSF